MVLAVTFALVLAQAAPLPQPTASANAAVTLTFAGGLKRLIQDTPNQLLNDRGARVTTTNGHLGYALDFAIEGLKSCRIGNNGHFFVTCLAYRGSDDATARSAYDNLKAQLRALAGDVAIPEKREATNGVAVTGVTYHPNNNVTVVLEHIQAEGGSAVALIVAPPGSY